MFKSILSIMSLLIFVGLIYAQDSEWQSLEDSDMEYNCEVLTTVLNAIETNDTEAATDFLGDDFIRIDDKEIDVEGFIGIRTTELLLNESEITVDTLFVDATTACNVEAESNVASSPDDTFNVIVNGNVNVRSCASTDCEVVGQAVNGSVLTVLEEQDDWYEFEFEGESAYIASWLTERGPDVYIEDLSEVYVDERTGCTIIADVRRGDMEMQFIIFGDERNSVFVDLYRPNDDNALDVEAQLDKTFTDTGEPYIQQYYHWGLYWYVGVHEIEISYGGETSRIAWNASSQADYNLFVTCD